MTYEIHEVNLSKLEKRLSTISKHCAKFDLPFTANQLGETFKKNDKGQLNRYVIMEISGNTSFEGWNFVAALDHMANGNLIRSISDTDLPEIYRTATSNCDHCKSSRKRNKTYVVRNESTGEYKQVGASCVRHFIGGVSAEAYARYIELIEDLVSFEKSGSAVPTSHWIDTEEYLMHVVECVKRFGYHKRSEEGIGMLYTAAVADAAMVPALWDKYQLEMFTEADYNADTEKNREVVRAALEWIKTKEADSDYVHTLKLAVSGKALSGRYLGFAASLIPVYYREVEKLEQKAQETKKADSSQHVGTIGERITFVGKVVFLTGYHTDFGYTFMYKIISDDNVFIWKTGKCIDDGTYTVTGTIKEHSEFKGTKQTVLTRCKVV